jgi:hypothetical protein
MRKFALSMLALVIAPIIASGTARAGQQLFFASRPAFFHQPIFFNRPAFFKRGVFFNRPFFFHRVPMGSSQIVPPFTSFTRGATIFSRGVATSFPVFLGDTGAFGTTVQADPSTGVTLIINTAPATPPPAPVAFSAPTVETSAAGVEVVRLMNTSLKPP